MSTADQTVLITMYVDDINFSYLDTNGTKFSELIVKKFGLTNKLFLNENKTEIINFNFHITSEQFSQVKLIY